MIPKFKKLAFLLCASMVVAACGNDAKPADQKPAVEAPKADGEMKDGDKKDGDKAAADASQKEGDKAAEDKKPEATGPVATVNGVNIERADYNSSVDELKKRFSMFGGNIPEAQLARFKQKIIERMVEDELINQELKKASVAVTDDEVNKELEQYKERTPGGPEQFEAFLKRSGMTMDKIKGDIQQRLALKKHLNKDGSLTIPEDESKKYYEENKKRYEVKERIKASHILIKVDAKADEAQQKEAKTKIDAIYKEASKKDADFATLAKAKSEGPSAPRGGDLGFFGEGRMVKEFEEAAFKLKPGQVSKPVKTQFGWHVIKVTDHQKAGQRTYDEVKDEIVQRLEARQFREARQKFVDDLRKNGKVEIIEKIEIPPPSPASMPGGMPGGMPGIKGMAPGGKQPIKIDAKSLKNIKPKMINPAAPKDGQPAPKAGGN